MNRISSKTRDRERQREREKCYTLVILMLLPRSRDDALLRRRKIARRRGESRDGNIFPEGWTRYACRDVFTVFIPPSHPVASHRFTLLLRHTATQSRDSLVRRKRNHDRVESSDGRQRENGLSVSSSRVGDGINDIIDARRETSTRCTYCCDKVMWVYIPRENFLILVLITRTWNETWNKKKKEKEKYAGLVKLMFN